MIHTIKGMLPWQLKIASKIVLSRIPSSYSFWKKLSLFQHGAMNKPEYAYEVFLRHFDRAKSRVELDNDFVVLELGPGDSLFSAQIAYALGANNSYLMDAGRFANEDKAIYQHMSHYIGERVNGRALPEFSDSLSSYISKLNCYYGTDGLASWRGVPDGSVDYIWSHAVLEHVARDEFLAHIQEMRRVIKPQGVSSHRVDLKDHLGGALNSLRFSSDVWESKFFSQSGFYTNRLRYSEIIEMMETAGFRVETVAVDRWESLPTPKSKMAAEFQGFDNDELRISGFDVLLYPN